jgi:general stress protein 26
MMSDLKQRILDIITKPQLAVLATVTEDGKPWCRYVSPLGKDDMTIRFSTFISSRKVQQFIKNPEVHITCGITDPMAMAPYLQIQGRAELTTDKDERHGFWNDMLSRIFSGPDDPKYAIVIVRPYRIEYNTPGSFTPEVWTKVKK